MVDFLTSSMFNANPEAYRPTIVPYEARSKRVAALAGHEVPAVADGEAAWMRYDFARLLTQANADSVLGMDATDLQLMTRIYQALSQTHRFGSDQRLDAHKGENPATHSLQCVNLMDEMLSRTDLPHDAELAMLRQRVGLGLLIHDAGEILGEFSTVAQRAANEALEEDPHAERRILEYALQLAMASIETGNLHGFHTTIARLREEAQIQQAGVPTGIAKSKEALDGLLQPQPPLSDEGKQRVAQWMALWDMAELKEADRQPGEPNLVYAGWLLKSIEHNQGTRHLLRVARRDSDHLQEAASSLGQTTGKLVEGGQRYNETELGHMFATAESALEKTVARAQAEQVYTTSIQMLDLMPSVMTRRVSERPPEIVAAEGTLSDEQQAYFTPRIMKQVERLDHTMRMQNKAGWVGMYALAKRAVREGRFEPKVIDGKGQVLLFDPPNEAQLPGVDRLWQSAMAR